MRGHSVVWTIERGCTRSFFECDYLPDALCHRFCDSCDSYETFDGKTCINCDKDLIDSGECQVVLFLGEAMPEETYDGTMRFIKSGPIEVEWDGQKYTWKYPAVEEK